MRILTLNEQGLVAGGLLPIDGSGGGGGSTGGGSTGGGSTGGGYSGGGACITQSQADTLAAWGKSAGAVAYGTAGTAVAAAMTDGWGAVAANTTTFFSGATLSEIGAYAGEQFGNAAASAWDDLVNVGNYIQGLWDTAESGGGVALGWYNFSYEDACTNTGASSF